MQINNVAPNLTACICITSACITSVSTSLLTVCSTGRKALRARWLQVRVSPRLRVSIQRSGVVLRWSDDGGGVEEVAEQ